MDRKQENTSKDLYRAKISPRQKSGLLQEKCPSIDVVELFCSISDLCPTAGL